MQHFAWSLPSSVKITSCQRTSIVAIDNAIWIEHGYHFEDKVLSQKSSLMIVWISQKGEHSSHHPGSNCLTRMHSCRYDNSLSLGKIVQIVPRCYGDDVAGLA